MYILMSTVYSKLCEFIVENNNQQGDEIYARSHWGIDILTMIVNAKISEKEK